MLKNSWLFYLSIAFLNTSQAKQFNQAWGQNKHKYKYINCWLSIKVPASLSSLEIKKWEHKLWSSSTLKFICGIIYIEGTSCLDHLYGTWQILKILLSHYITSILTFSGFVFQPLLLLFHNLLKLPYCVDFFWMIGILISLLVQPHQYLLRFRVSQAEDKTCVG